MYSLNDLIDDLGALGVSPTDTLLVHSSMRAVGPVQGRADTVLDALAYAVRNGLLILPTHSWATMNEEHRIFDPENEPSCVGILTNLFRKRPSVLRSLHPTHSVAAFGQDAANYVSGEETHDTPCARDGCWGKLIDRHAKVLFLGCPLTKNTFLHGVEEWNHIPNRLDPALRPYAIQLADGRLLPRPMHRHHCSLCPDVSANYGKMEPVFLHTGIARAGRVGDARAVLCDAAGMADMTSALLSRNPDLFIDGAPVPEAWY